MKDEMRQDDTTEFLRSLVSKGVRLWSEDGKLHYEAARGTLSRDDIEALRKSKSQIIGLLKYEDSGSGRGIEPRHPGTRTAQVPLAFSQLQHWNLYELRRRRAIRTVSSAIRLQGRLNVSALRKSLEIMIQRHETLRTRVVLCGGVPTQEITDTAACDFEVVDLTAVKKAQREEEVAQRIRQVILEEVDWAIGPLFAARLLKLEDAEHVLVMAMEHTISDGFSLNILTRDLFTAYAQVVRGVPVSLRPLRSQFADYVVWQRNTHRAWREQHEQYWREKLAGFGRLRFPEDASLPAGTLSGRGSVEITIDRELKARLEEWCRERRTTVAMTLFAAYSGLVLRWCGKQEGIFQYQTNARFDTDIADTVGYFAAVLYLHISLRERDNFVDLVRRATEEYCAAYEHNDFSYLAAQTPRPEFTRNTSFNWIPLGSVDIDVSSLGGSGEELTASPVHFVYPAPNDFEVDREPFILVSDAQGEIVADLYFSVNRFSVRLMERFGRNLLHFVNSVLCSGDTRVCDVAVV